MSEFTKNQLKKWETEVQNIIREVGRNHPPPASWYFKSRLKCIAGIPVGIQRKLHRRGFSFSDMDNRLLARAWDGIWKTSRCFEVRNQCLYYFENRKRASLSLDDWRLLREWVYDVDNWAHSDSLSSIYSDLHEQYPSKILPVFKQWNRDSNPWARRASIVSIYYYSSLRKTPVPYKTALPLVKNLLEDDFVYVQKGVGWTLREIYNLYPDEVWKFLTAHAGRIPAAAWQAATEKLPAGKKKHLKQLRRGKA